MKLRGTVGGSEVVVMVDSGASHCSAIALSMKRQSIDLACKYHPLANLEFNWVMDLAPFLWVSIEQ